jgi:hypothetical protein
MAAAALPAVKRPTGVAVLTGLLLLGSVSLLIRTLIQHVGGLSGVGRLLAVLVLGLLAYGI